MLFNMLGYMLISSFTPGPGNILALNTMVNYGWKKGRRLVLGIGIGYLVVQYMCTLAVYFLNAYLNNAMVYIKYLGAVYLIWFALHIALSKKYEQNNKKEASFTVGFFMQLVNVKIYFYCMTLLSAYIIPMMSDMTAVLLMGIFVVFIGCTATLTWAFLGIKLEKFYKAHFKVCNVILALFLVYCAVNIIWS